MKREFPCCICDWSIPHPDVEDCESIDGACVHLVHLGAVPMIVRIYADYPPSRKAKLRHVASRGAWACPECARKFHLTVAKRSGLVFTNGVHE